MRKRPSRNYNRNCIDKYILLLAYNMYDRMYIQILFNIYRLYIFNNEINIYLNILQYSLIWIYY